MERSEVLVSTAVGQEVSRRLGGEGTPLKCSARVTLDALLCFTSKTSKPQPTRNWI